MKINVWILFSLTIYVHFVTAFVKDGGSGFFNFKFNISDSILVYNIREQIKDQINRNISSEVSVDLVPYPIEVDLSWDKKAQVEFVKSFQNAKEKSEITKSLPKTKKRPGKGGNREPVSGGDPMTESSGVVGTSDNRAGVFLHFLRSNTCPPLYACRSPTFTNKCCTFKFIQGKYYCDYQACYGFF